MTTTGMEVFLALCHFLFSSQHWFAPGSLYDSSYTSFTSMDFDFPPNTTLSSSFSSSSSSNSQQQTQQQQVESGLERNSFLNQSSEAKSSILAKLCEIFAAFPSLTRASDVLRRQKFETSSSHFLPNQVDYDDLSLLLCILCMSVDIHIFRPLLHSPPGMTLSVGSSPLWRMVCESMDHLPSDSQLSQFINPLAAMLESHLLASSHPAVSICVTRLLISLTSEVPYRRRIPSLLWFLVTTLHEPNKKSFFPISKKGSFGMNRNGLLVHALEEYLTAPIADLLTHSNSSVGVNGATMPSSNSKKTVAVESQCRALVSQAISLAQISRGMSFSSLAEHESFDTFVVSWSLWWKHETHCHDTASVTGVGRRAAKTSLSSPAVMCGVYLLVMEIFRVLKKRKHLSSPTQTTAGQGSSVGSFHSKRRTSSRVIKPVDRYQPEQNVLEAEESGEEGEGSDDETDGEGEVMKLRPSPEAIEPNSSPSRPSLETEVHLNEILLQYKSSVEKDLSNAQRETIFRRIQTENVEKYFSFALSFLPTLLLLAPASSSPPPSSSHSSFLSADSRWGPYASIIFAIQVLIITLSEFILLLPTAPSLILSHSPHLIRVLKITLLALEQTIQQCLQWRITATLPPTFSSSPTAQWNSSQYLVPLLQSSLILLELMSFLSQILTNHLLFSQLICPKRLIQMLPQFAVSVDRSKGKILQIMESHQLMDFATMQLQETEGIQSFHWLHSQALLYAQRHREIFSKPFCEEEEEIDHFGTVAELSESPPQGLPGHGHSSLSLEVNDGRGLGDILVAEEEKEEGFRVSTAVSFGWGIYK
jgi:hypothetical protein